MQVSVNKSFSFHFNNTLAFMHKVTFREGKTYFYSMYTEIVVLLLHASNIAYGKADVYESQRTTDEIV